VDEIATEFYEQALKLWRDENWNSAKLFAEFQRRYGQHAVGRSSFYRWVEHRLLEGHAPDPLACDPRLGVSAPDVPSPREVVDLDADPPEFQSRVMLDLALRLPRGEIEILDAQLTPLKVDGEITLAETALLRAVRARQSHDLAMERDARFWVI
jgi:hypothetical protein